MANVCCRARVALQSCSTKNAVVSKLFGPKSPSVGGKTSKLPGFTTSSNPNSSPNISPQRLFSSSRLPVELACAQSLMPLHSATASALFTSLLSVHAQSWGSLSEVYCVSMLEVLRSPYYIVLVGTYEDFFKLICFFASVCSRPRNTLPSTLVLPPHYNEAFNCANAGNTGFML
ncbi:hypothetical protein KSS87_020746 [Heliosperma pusillum]|nr:hypothetical protein KSS87_020746 [Heliosperma pusillum]